MVLQRVGGCPGRLCAPELVDEPVCRDDLVRTREKECEKRPLPRAAERERTALLDDLERSQDAELHVFSSRGSFCSTAATLTPRRQLSRGSAVPQHRRRPFLLAAGGGVGLEQEDG